MPPLLSAASGAPGPPAILSQQPAADNMFYSVWAPHRGPGSSQSCRAHWRGSDPPGSSSSLAAGPEPAHPYEDSAQTNRTHNTDRHGYCDPMTHAPTLSIRTVPPPRSRDEDLPREMSRGACSTDSRQSLAPKCKWVSRVRQSSAEQTAAAAGDHSPKHFFPRASWISR
jgi:hypothetical protein